MAEAEIMKAVAAALRLVTSLTQGGQLYVLSPEGEMQKACLSPKQLAQLKRAMSSGTASNDAEIEVLRTRVEEITRPDGDGAKGLTPHHRYDAKSLRELVSLLDVNPYFIGPFRKAKAWSAMPFYGRGAVKRHQTERQRNAQKQD
jgi:hypothetical protein